MRSPALSVRLSLVAGTAVVLVSTDVLASQAMADNELDEIVVTARKRDESFRDVPVTESVFTASTIEAAGIQKPGDFIAMVPNMTLVETQNAGNAFVVLRGISQARNSEPSVAVLVDGVLETNPAQFNQELFDIQQIEVLKGPQGALYGRNAIGGAILIATREPSDETEGSVKLGVGNGASKRFQAGVTGPVGASETLKYRASFNYFDTDGHLPSTFLGGKADPAKNYSGRARLSWTPSEVFSGDLRVAYDKLETRALYFVIPRDDEANPFSSFSTAPDANDVTSPIQIDNAGKNDRDLFNTSLKLDFGLGGGTLTTVSAYDTTREILTGDAYDFRPAASSVFNAIYGNDLTQSQYLNVKAFSQEVRFSSPAEGRFRWITGAYLVSTKRFISTGNMVDTGNGVFPVYRTPSANPLNPQVDGSGDALLSQGATFLADTQDNNAWALFANATLDVTDQFQIDAAIRYDRDRRKNTTNTPQDFLSFVDPSAVTGQVRRHTWSQTQPKVTLRYKPAEEITFYGGWSRGFRSGGFNQTGVGAVADDNDIDGVNDLFAAEVADTWEIGAKGQFFQRRLNAGLSLYRTESRNGYFFVFLAQNSTQNLGNLDATYKGAELDLSARVTNRLDLYANFGYTNSRITAMEDPSVVGNKAPLAARTTLNLGAQYRQPLTARLSGLVRVDFQQFGRTWWEPYNLTSRDPVSLVNARLGIESDNWKVTAWGKNLGDKAYNAEFSPGGFLFRAQPRTFGLEVLYEF